MYGLLGGGRRYHTWLGVAASDLSAALRAEEKGAREAAKDKRRQQRDAAVLTARRDQEHLEIMKQARCSAVV